MVKYKYLRNFAKIMKKIAELKPSLTQCFDTNSCGIILNIFAFLLEVGLGVQARYPLSNVQRCIPGDFGNISLVQKLILLGVTGRQSPYFIIDFHIFLSQLLIVLIFDYFRK